jgi:transposase-like protein
MEGLFRRRTMGNQRRKFSGSFKAEVTFAAVKGDRTLAELAHGSVARPGQAPSSICRVSTAKE